MNTRAMIIGSTLTLTLALGALGPAAYARTINGNAGRQAGGANAACFFEQFGAIRNTCSSSQNWGMPGVIDAPGTYSPSYNLYVPAGSTVQCITYSGSWTGTITVTPWTNPVGGPGYPTVSPGPVTVPTHGYVAGTCALGPNASLFDEEY